MGPPGLTATLSERRNTSAVTPDDLIRDANLLMEKCGFYRSPSWISRTVRAYLRSNVRGLPFGQVLAARLELNAQQRAELEAKAQLYFSLSYADPTGETATRNADRDRRRR